MLSEKFLNEFEEYLKSGRLEEDIHNKRKDMVKRVIKSSKG